ncbi:MAG: hypothetical protein ABH952_10725 [Candidatus Omnitrophota bacterium]
METKDLKIEMKKSHTKRWRKTTVEHFLQIVEITRTILLETRDSSHNPDDYTEECALWYLITGKVVDTPVLQFRLAEGDVCHYCKAKFIKKYGALSRLDNKTYICASCGMKEAIQDIPRNSE